MKGGEPNHFLYLLGLCPGSDGRCALSMAGLWQETVVLTLPTFRLTWLCRSAPSVNGGLWPQIVVPTLPTCRQWSGVTWL